MTDVLDRTVRLADADTIRNRFASPAWGESHSGTRLAETLGRDAGATKPALGVVMALELAIADYAISLGPSSAVLVLGPLSMRKGQIADIITTTPEDASAVRAALAVVEAHATGGHAMTETTQPDPQDAAVLHGDGWVIDGLAVEGDPDGEVYYDAAGNGWRIHKPTEPDTDEDAP